MQRGKEEGGMGEAQVVGNKGRVSEMLESEDIIGDFNFRNTD